MKIQHNMAAFTAARNLNIVYNKQTVLAEKLSSGYSINRAADNAAGLKISEKMRSQIRGLNQASTNAQDAVSLLQTADGALNEVHSILQRVRELSVQAANDTNVDADRQSLQEEVDQLLEEINRISGQTEFNTRKIFDGSLDAANAGGGTSPYQTFNSVVIDIEGTVDEFSTSQQSSGGSGVSASYTKLAETLDKSLVPQAVNALLNVYSDAFGYLKDSSTGIGLVIENRSSSSALASVTLSTGAGTIGADGTLRLPLGFKLTVNTAYLTTQADGELTEDSRRALEGTILHEMVHAVMDEATTAGMLGIKGTEQNKAAYGFPFWFKEGMAQTAVGGYSNDNDWVNSGLRINTSKSVDQIAAIVKSSLNKLGSSSSSSGYGTGYLACMYLGQLASGKGFSSTAITPQNIRAGLNKVMGKIVSGQSLDSVINEVSGGTYSSSSDFESKFGDTQSATFIRDLTAAVGEGNGSLVTNDFHDTDLLPDTNATSTFLDLNPNTKTVINTYPDDVVIMSGGTKSNAGNKPIASYAPGTSGGMAATGGGTGGTGGTGGMGGTGGTGGTGSITGGLMIQVGANSGQAMSLSFGEVTTDKLGLTGLSLMSHQEAGEAIDKTDKAINQVSTIRSRIGAYQNRLEYAIENLDNTAENLQSAEARIRDLDMAEAMVEYSKNAIVMQAAQAMLAQANQSQGGILKLLQ